MSDDVPSIIAPSCKRDILTIGIDSAFDPSITLPFKVPLCEKENEKERKNRTKKV
tara:strand:+ start:615 stop:779 length:165 start_codon:yes stop_codon:yes gene_type:complete